jgi:tetratricopeptide (TPR) repeat protein
VSPTPYRPSNRRHSSATQARPLLLLVMLGTAALFLLTPNPLHAQQQAAGAADEDLRIAEGLFQRELYPLAEEAFADWCRRNPNHPQFPLARFRQAEAMRLQGRFEAARPLYLSLVQPTTGARPASAGYRDLALFRIGEFELTQNRGALAADALAGIEPDKLPPALRPTHLVYWGRACYIANQTAAAQGIFRRLLEDPSAESTPAMQEQALYFLGRIALEQKRWDEALDLYQQLAALPEADPNLRIEAALQQVNLRYRLRQFAEAAAEADAFLREYPRHAQSQEVLKTLLWSQLALGDYDAILDRLASSAPRLEDPDLLYLLAHAYRNKERFDLALRFYDRLAATATSSAALHEKAAWEAALTAAHIETPARVIQRVNQFAERYANSPFIPELYLLAARSYLQAGQPHNALPAIEGAIERIAPESPVYESALGLRADILFQAGRFQEAAATFAELRRRFPDAQTAAAWGLAQIRALNAAGDHAAALQRIEAIGTAFDTLPDRKEGLLFEKAVALAGLGRTDSMLQTLEAYLNLPNAQRNLAKAQFLKGIRLFADEQWPEAIAALEAALKEPSLPKELIAQAQTQLAVAWQKEGRPERAAELFRKSLADGRAAALSDQTLLWLAHFDLESDRFEEAQRPLVILLHRELPQPLRQAGLLASGYAHLGQGSLEKAVESLQAAQTLEPTNQTGIEAALALGDLYRGDPGRLDQARNAFGTALQHAGGNWPELAARARFGLGQVAQDKGEPAEAAKQFMGLAILYDLPDLTPRALALAAEAFEAAGQPDAAQEARAELKRRYPADSTPADSTDLPTNSP